MDEKKIRYQCVVCGHIEEVDSELESDFVCPVCGVDYSNFVKID